MHLLLVLVSSCSQVNINIIVSARLIVTTKRNRLCSSKCDTINLLQFLNFPWIAKIIRTFLCAGYYVKSFVLAFRRHDVGIQHSSTDCILNALKPSHYLPTAPHLQHSPMVFLIICLNNLSHLSYSHLDNAFQAVSEK